MVRSRAKAAIGFSYSEEGEGKERPDFLQPDDEKERAFSSESEYGRSINNYYARNSNLIFSLKLHQIITTL